MKQPAHGLAGQRRCHARLPYNAFAIAITMSAGISPATAQTEAAAISGQPTAIDEIIVTARRREERLSDVPLAATVLDAYELLSRGPPTETRSLLAGVPGLRFNDSTSPTTSEITLRGSGTGRGTSADSGVGLYRDDVYIGGGLQYGRNYLRLDMFDLDRVEVLRGSLGALYGRNAVGGAINVISARPQFERSGRADVDYGWDVEGKQAQVVVNEPLSEHFAVRVGVDYVDQDEGYYFNKSFNEFLDAEDGYGARAQIRFLSGNLDVNLLVEQQEDRVGKIVAALAIPPTIPNFPLGYSDEKYAYNWSSQGVAELDLENAVLSITYDFGGAQLTSSSAYRDRHGITRTDIDNFSPESKAAEQARGNPMTTVDPGQDLTADDTTRTFYQELHVSGEVGKVAWLLGADYIDLESDFLVRFARTAGFLGVPLPGIDTFQTLEYESVAGYGSIEYAFTPAFSMTAELRQTRDTKDFTTTARILGTSTVVAPLTEIEPTFHNTAYNVLASYHFAPSVMAYAKVGTGYRVGGFNTVVTVPNQPRPVPQSYDNEDSTTYEAGLKSDIGASTHLALAGYFTKVSGALVTDTNGCSLANACGQNPTSFTTNGGDGEIWGVELEGATHFDIGGGRLDLDLALSRQEGKFTSGLFDGFEIPQTPDVSAGAQLRYAHPVGMASELSMEVDYHAQWDGVQDVTSPVFELADRQITDLRIGFHREQWELSAYVDNVFDEEYYVLRQPTLFRWNNDRRNAGLRFRYRW